MSPVFEYKSKEIMSISASLPQALWVGSQDTEGLGEAAAGEPQRYESLLSTLHHLELLN